MPTAAPTDAEFLAAREFLGTLPGTEDGREPSAGETQAAYGFGYGRSAGSSYHGASIDPQTRNWLPLPRAGDDMLRESWPLLTARINDLIRNEPSLGALKRGLVKHIVGPGIATYAEAIDDAGEEIDAFNDEADEAFERYAAREIDVEGKLHWGAMQWHVQDHTIEKGDGLLLVCHDDRPGRSIPLAFQWLEADQLDQLKDFPADASGNRTVRGIELDRFNRPTAYWIFDAHPFAFEGWTSESRRIEADRVIHYYVPFMPSMTRGISWFHALTRSTRDCDWLIGAELTSAALAAQMTLVHKTANAAAAQQAGMGLSDDLPGSDRFGNALLKLGPGVISRIAREDDVSVVQSNRPSKEVKPFVEFLRQEQSMGGGLSYITHTGDFSKTSFSSALGAINEEQAYIEPLQLALGHRVVCPVRERWTRYAAAYGVLRSVTASRFLKQQPRYLRLDLQPPGRARLNPLDQNEGASAGIRNGTSTLKDESGAVGRNWKRNIRQKSREQAYAQRFSVDLDFSKGASAAAKGDAGRGAKPEPNDEGGAP